MARPPLDAKTRRNLLVGGALLALLLFLFYDRMYRPQSARAAELETRLGQLQTQNAAARALTAGESEDVEARLQGYRAQLEAVEGLIPSSEEVPDLLDAITLEAQRTGVEITLIQPVSATDEQFYTRHVYDMAVVGPYHAIGDFLARVGSLPRIVTPTNLTLQPRAPTAPGAAAAADEDGPIRLEARFSIETYVIPATPVSDASAD